VSPCSIQQNINATCVKIRLGVSSGAPCINKTNYRRFFDSLPGHWQNRRMPNIETPAPKGDGAGNPTAPAPVRTFTTTVRIRACRLRREDLARVYRIINERQIQYGQSFVKDVLGQQPNESPEQFKERQFRVLHSFTITVNITGANNEIVSGSGAHFLASENIPDRLLTMYYTNIAGPNALGIALQNRVTVLLDFAQPAIFDFTKLPTHATENASNFQIAAVSEEWFTTLNTRLTQLFDERRTRVDWLHRTGVYDIFLLLIGLPITLWADYRSTWIIDRLKLSNILAAGVYVYVFFAILFLFRGLFHYSRWAFPKIEMDTGQSRPQRHRVVLLGIIIAVLGAAIWDAIKALS
jgi:hypothetical protein